MGSLAVLAKEKGLTVSGSDANVYPPMSTQLKAQGIEIMEGYQVSHLNPSGSSDHRQRTFEGKCCSRVCD